MLAGNFVDQLAQSAAGNEGVAQALSPASADGRADLSGASYASPEGTVFNSPGRKSRVDPAEAANPFRDGISTADDNATAFDPTEFGNFSFDFGAAEF